MASLISVRLDKGGAPSLGFRLQGGKDFGTPLVIQKVNGGSPAERAGLIAGDSVIKINNVDVFNLRHKDAQDVIVRAGPSFEVTVQRGGSTWKPSVIPTGSFPAPAPTLHAVSPVTKTSLAAGKRENIGAIGTGHNVSAKPFSAQVNGVNGGGPRLVNNQYNSPLKLYSEESIAETLSAQTEVLPTGALGVNFKKNEKNYDATNSAVFRMLQEAENEPKSPDLEPDSGVCTAPLGVAGLRHVAAPENRPKPPTPQLPPGQNICADCERLIVGVFVRIKDKNLHVECFKCSTCGSSLKNVGYYNINNKLYCDVHAKLAARNNPPAPNLLPVTVPPGGKIPANAISAALSSHSLPSPSPLSPRSSGVAPPFQPQDDKGDDIAVPLQNLSVNEANNNKINNNLLNSTPLSFNKYISKTGNSYGGPKPFSSVSSPLSPPNYNNLPKAAPLSPVAPAPPSSYSPASSAGRSIQNIVWPPPQEEPDLPTACPLYFPPPSQVQVAQLEKKLHAEDYGGDEEELEEFDLLARYQAEPKMSFCSEEVYNLTERKSSVECVEKISETLQTQKLVENVLKTMPRPASPPPEPAMGHAIIASQERMIEDRFECASTISSESCDLKRPTDYSPNTKESPLRPQAVQNTVPQKWESQMLQALKLGSDRSDDPFTQIPTKFSASALASALKIAPSEPFNPQPPMSRDPIPLPEETVPYFPPEHPIVIEPKEPKPKKEDSKFVKALKTVPEAPPEPAPIRRKKKDPTDEYFKDLPKPERKLTMREALTTASDRAFSPQMCEMVQTETKTETMDLKETKVVEKQKLLKPLKPATLPASFQPPPKTEPKNPVSYPLLQCVKSTKTEEKQSEQQVDVKQIKTVERSVKPGSIQVTTEEPTETGLYPLFKGFSCTFDNKTDHSHFQIEISTSPPILNIESKSKVIQTASEQTEKVTEETTITEKKASSMKSAEHKREVIAKQAEDVILKKPLPLTSALHKPENLPQYQVNISESAEADLKLMQKVEAAQVRHEKKKVVAPSVSEPLQRPIITIQPGDINPQPELFKPVVEGKPPSTTFSPRPRSVTPSMINKPPPMIPYYQASLVPQHYGAPHVNLLDPATPNVSRSPSPCPEKRSFSPFPSATPSAVRPKSPAAGPPPNPLRAPQPPPQPKDFKFDEAKRSLTTYIPQYKSRRDVIERERNLEVAEAMGTQMYTSEVSTKNLPAKNMKSGVDKVGILKKSDETSVMTSSENLQNVQQRGLEKRHMEVEDMQQAQLLCRQTSHGVESTAISAQSHAEHLEHLKTSETKSVEQTTDGRVQIQRKKTVTEEFEHKQKLQTIQIEKNVSSTKTHPFHDVNNPTIEGQGVMGLHITNPQPLQSPFLKSGGSQAASASASSCQQQSQCQQKVQVSKSDSCQKPCGVCPFQPTSSTVQPKPLKSSLPQPFKAPAKHVSAPGSSQTPCANKSNVPVPDAGSGGGRQTGAIGVAPKRGRGVLNAASLGGTRVPLCGQCHSQIRGPFITALGKIWCPEHFICATPSCRRPLQDLGFVEERGQLYCEYCFEQYLAPACSKCGAKIKGDCLKAIGKNFHPECFNCVYCGKLFANNPFFLEDGNPYCEADWNELFTTKCFACGFPVEAGDRWVEALNNNYHSQCFNCTMCKKNLEGQSFVAKGGRPFCKNHAR